MQHAFTFPQCVYASSRVLCFLQFYNLTIRHNNSRLSKTCHHISVTSSQSFASAALLRFAGSDPNAEASVLGVKMAVWQFIKKYLNDFIDGSGRSSRDCHCTHTGWCARRNTLSRGLLLLCDRLMQRCGVYLCFLCSLFRINQKQIKRNNA